MVWNAAVMTEVMLVKGWMVVPLERGEAQGTPPTHPPNKEVTTLMKVMGMEMMLMVTPDPIWRAGGPGGVPPYSSA